MCIRTCRGMVAVFSLANQGHDTRSLQAFLGCPRFRAAMVTSREALVDPRGIGLIVIVGNAFGGK
jgi:hypothetical protein